MKRNMSITVFECFLGQFFFGGVVGVGGHNTCVNIHQKWFGIRCLTFFSLFKIFLESLNDNNKKEEFLTALLFLVVFAALAITDYYAALKKQNKNHYLKTFYVILVVFI